MPADYIGSAKEDKKLGKAKTYYREHGYTPKEALGKSEVEQKKAIGKKMAENPPIPEFNRLNQRFPNGKPKSLKKGK